MTLSELEDIIKKGTLVLSKEYLATGALSSISRFLLLNNSSLSLSNIEPIDEKHLLFNKADYFLGERDQKIQALFFEHENEVHCIIETELESWAFYRFYHELPEYTDYAQPTKGNQPSFFNHLPLGAKTTILFSTYDFTADKENKPIDQLKLINAQSKVSKLHLGLNFFSSVDLNKCDFLQAAGKLLNLNSTNAFHGYLEGREGRQKIRLEISLLDQSNKLDRNRTIKLSKGKSIDLGPFIVYLNQVEFYTSKSLYDVNVGSGVTFIGGFSFEKTEGHPFLAQLPLNDIAIDWPVGSQSLTIRNHKPIKLKNIYEAFCLLVKDAPNTESAPFPIQKDNNFWDQLMLQELAIGLDFSGQPPNITTASLAIGVENIDIEIVKGLELSEACIRLELSTNVSVPPYVILTSIWEIGDGKILLSASYPDYLFRGELIQGTSIQLHELLKPYFPDHGLPVLEILELEVMLDIPNSHYIFEIDIHSDWDILNNCSAKEESKSLIIEDLRIALEKEQDFTYVSLDSTLNIAGIDVYLSASNANSAGAGWDFTGRTGYGEAIPIGEIIKDIAAKFSTDAVVPKALESLVIENVFSQFNTLTKNFKFECAAFFDIGDEGGAAIVLTIAVTKKIDGTYQQHFEGHMTVGELQFSLIFDTDKESTNFLASYHGNASIDIKQLVGDIYPQFETSIPEGIKISLRDALFLYHKAQAAPDGTEAKAKLLFSLNIDSGINLSNLPLVGKLLPKDQLLSLNLQLQAFDHLNKFTIGDNGEISKIHQAFPGELINFPPDTATSDFLLVTNLQISGKSIPLPMPFEPIASTPVTDSKGQTTYTNPVRATQTDTTTQWFPVQQSLGPVHFNRIGIGFAHSKLKFALDASLQMGGLTIALSGLSVSSSLDSFKPKFDLKGLGIDFKNDEVEIGAAFLREHVGKASPEGYDEYSGFAVVKFEGISISAFGAYAYVNNAPSLFIYASLDEPLGGPAFFFVTGISAGFGYNRALRVPTLNQIMGFPLVADAINASSSSAITDKNSLTQKLQSLQQYIVPSAGQMFFAIGLRFTSFKLIDSSLFLAASFGNRFELNLLGISSLVVPAIADESTNEDGTIPTRLAVVELLLKGSLIPAEGFVGLQGVLSANSYILSKNCHLSGGFAFYAWFNGDHSGDFVTTIGGYHPHFKVPAHYPKVPRVGFNWKVDEAGTMLIKGDMYFALCAHALMAGGHLEATFQSGALKAWFKIGADFLVAWQPYHYEASMYVDIGCSYTFQCFGTQHITIDVGADVNIWGPEFGGHAVVHLWIFSINVDFGKQSSAESKAIDWSKFKASFLPKEDNLCNITVSKGLVSKGADKDHLGIINPKELCITTDAFIPSKKVEGVVDIDGVWNTDFGIASMDLSDKNLLCSQTFTIKTSGESVRDAKKYFKFTALTKRIPAGLWGTSLKPEVNDAQFIENAFSGLKIEPKGCLLYTSDAADD